MGLARGASWILCAFVDVIGMSNLSLNPEDGGKLDVGSVSEWNRRMSVQVSFGSSLPPKASVRYPHFGIKSAV